MKQEIASREVALGLGRTLEPGEKPGPVVFENLSTQRVLERLGAKKTDPVAVREWIAQYARRTGAEPKRASMLLRNPGDPQFYEAMYKWLAESEPVAEPALHDLAESRAKVVLEALRLAGVDEARLESAPVKSSNREKSKRVSAELSLAPVEPSRTTARPDTSGAVAQAVH
jgi:hypothetical protein